MLTAAQLSSVLRAHRLRLTKRLGQHHLVDARVVRRVIEACGVNSGETVVEIGAGLGALTEPLAQQGAAVIAIEVDRKIAALLAERMASQHRVEVICEDILAFSWDRFRDVIVVGAIPYHITSPILVSLCEHRSRIRAATLILQEEVARRLLAVPGTKAYGRLSVLVQYGWEAGKRFRIPRSAFFPQPDVDSLCLVLTRRSRPPFEVDREEVFFDIIKAAFAQRRKTLVNCLSVAGHRAWSRPRIEAALRAQDLLPSIRGEALSLQQLAAIANTLARSGE